MPSYPWQIQYPDLADAFLKGQQIRANQLTFEEKQREISSRPQLADAVKAWQQGDSSQLLLLNPTLYDRLEKYRAGSAKTKALEEKNTLEGLKNRAEREQLLWKEQDASAKRALEQEQGRNTVLANVLPLVARNPAIASGVQQQLGALRNFQGQDLGWIADPEQVKQRAEVLPVAMRKLQDPEFEPDFKQAANILGYGPQSPKGEYDAAWQDPGFGETLRKVSEEQRKAKGTNISLQVGNQPTTMATTTKLQGELSDDEQLLSDVNQLQKMDFNQFLGLGGRIKGKVLKGLDYIVGLPKDSQEFVQQRRAFRETVEQIFNEYRRRVTGAAASVQELSALRESIINTDLSPSEFAGSMRHFMEKLQRAMRIKRRILREGIDVNPEESARRFDTLWRTGEQGNAGNDVKDRLGSILQAGVGPDSTAEQMVNEGFWDQGQADDWLMQVKK